MVVPLLINVVLLFVSKPFSIFLGNSVLSRSFDNQGPSGKTFHEDLAFISSLHLFVVRWLLSPSFSLHQR